MWGYQKFSLLEKLSLKKFIRDIMCDRDGNSFGDRLHGGSLISSIWVPIFETEDIRLKLTKKIHNGGFILFMKYYLIP